MHKLVGIDAWAIFSSRIINWTAKEIRDLKKERRLWKWIDACIPGVVCVGCT